MLVFIYIYIYCFVFDRQGMKSTNWQQPQKMESKSPKEAKRAKRTWRNLRKKWNWYEIIKKMYFIKHTNLLKSHITLALKIFDLKKNISKTFMILPV